MMSTEQKSNPNVNCLDNMKCPGCGSYGPFKIQVNTVMMVTDEGVDEQVGDNEWDNESHIQCSECEQDGKVIEFQEPVPEPPFDPKRNVTRAELMELLVDDRSANWDHSDTCEVLEYGRNGFAEMTNAELEEVANGSYQLTDEEGRELEYHITDADTHTVSEEERLREINKELLEALKGLVGEIQLGKLNIRKDFSLINAHACASKAIAGAEGK